MTLRVLLILSVAALAFAEYPNWTLFGFHSILFILLYKATKQDLETMTISDTITVFGTVFALVWAMFFAGHHTGQVQPLMILLWCFWCFAMLDRFWSLKMPLWKNMFITMRRIRRSPHTKYYLTAAVAGSVLLTRFPGESVSSSLTGMTMGMVLIWTTRILCSCVLRQEAMGFGDVTLMGMIGAFAGWQAAVLVFFLAPFTGLVFGLIQYIRTGNHRLPYGPFLAAATVLVLIFWKFLNQQTEDIFALGLGFVVSALLVCFVLMGVLLTVIHKLFHRQ